MARNVPSGTTAATAAQAAAPAPQPKPATAALPAASTGAKPAASTAPRTAAPKAPAASKTSAPPATGPGKGPPTYGQSYQGGWSSADFAYDNLGQSDATDIAPFEKFPTSQTTPGEGTSFYRERMMAQKPGFVGLGEGQMYVPSQYGKRGGYVQPTSPAELRSPEYSRQFQSVAEFRDYAQRVGAGLTRAEQATSDAERRLRYAASNDETTRAELDQLYQEKLKRLSEVAGMKTLLRRQGFTEEDLETVKRHAAEREY